MKVLSLSRPWPWSFFNAGKPLENRRREDGRMPAICRHRGPLLLHAAKSWDKEAVPFMRFRRLVDSATLDAIDAPGLHPAGAIVGRCVAIGHVAPDGKMYRHPNGGDFDAVLPPKGSPRVRMMFRGHLIDSGWWFGGYALIVADVHLIGQPIEYRGHLGLRDAPIEVELVLRDRGHWVQA